MNMLRFDGEVWEIALGHGNDEDSVNVRKAVPGRDDRAIAAGVEYIQSDGRRGKTIAAREIRQVS